MPGENRYRNESQLITTMTKTFYVADKSQKRNRGELNKSVLIGSYKSRM